MGVVKKKCSPVIKRPEKIKQEPYKPIFESFTEIGESKTDLNWVGLKRVLLKYQINVFTKIKEKKIKQESKNWYNELNEQITKLWWKYSKWCNKYYINWYNGEQL